MKKLIQNTLKLAAAGGVIAGIGFIALTQEQPAQVKEAHADVAAFSFGDDGNDFTRAMVSLGLEPRPYEFNGNTMYFAAGTTQKTPAQLEPIIAQALMEHGVNTKDATEQAPMTGAAAQWEMPDNPDGEADPLAILKNLQRFTPHGEAMLDGEVITVARDHDLLRMVGQDWNKSREQIVEDAKTGYIPLREVSGKKLMGGYKYIEANYDPADGTTDVSAVWNADDDFDPAKMDNTAFLQAEPDPNVPACMGCERRVRMKSLAKKEPLQANQWHTNSNLRQTYDFYKSAMASRGWKRSESQMILDRAGEIVPELGELQGRILNLEKDGKAMQIVLIPSEKGGTEVFSQERFRDATQILTNPGEAAKR